MAIVMAQMSAGRCQPVGALSVTVVGTGGESVENAVVWIDVGSTGSPATPSRAVMNQANQQFSPFVLPVAVGTTVDFPNNDPFRHHVYSFSAAKPFELKLYGGGEVQTVTFDTPGPIALGCNIHDNMLAYVYVVPSPYFAKTDNRGQAQIEGVPAGTHRVLVWHPNQRAVAAASETTVQEGAVALITLTVSLRPERRSRRPGAYDERGY